MDTATRNAHLDRIHAIWQRRAARFKQAAYAYRLADELSDRLSRQHLDYVRARMLATRAARVMDILCRQTMKLARLEIVAAGFAVAATAPGAQAADEWTDAQAGKAVALATLAAADWAQTRNIARHPARWHETNPLLGEHPSVAQVDRHFAVSALIGAAALHALPTRYRDWALNAGLVIEAGCVANNLRLGIGIRF